MVTSKGSYNKEYYEKNKEKFAEKSKRWRDNNIVRVKKVERIRALKKNYGITADQYQVLVEKQQGVCAICQRKCTTHKYLSVDHCHKTKKIRGLLCNKCNRAIGLFADDPVIVEKALLYLQESNEKVVAQSSC